MQDVRLFIKKQGLKYCEIYRALGLDPVKFDRWARPGNINNRVLLYATKFVIRVILETRRVEAQRKQDKKQVVEDLRRKMDKVGL